MPHAYAVFDFASKNQPSRKACQRRWNLGTAALARNNYFIGPNFENAVGFFVGGEKSLLLSNFGSELSEKRVKNLVKQYDF